MLLFNLSYRIVHVEEFSWLASDWLLVVEELLADFLSPLLLPFAISPLDLPFLSKALSL